MVGTRTSRAGSNPPGDSFALVPLIWYTSIVKPLVNGCHMVDFNKLVKKKLDSNPIDPVALYDTLGRF